MFCTTVTLVLPLPGNLPIRTVFQSADHNIYLIGKVPESERELYLLNEFGEIDNTFGNNGRIVLSGNHLSVDIAVISKDQESFTCIGILDSSGVERRASVLILDRFDFQGNRVINFGNNGIALSDTIASTFSAGVPLGVYHVVQNDSFLNVASNALYNTSDGTQVDHVVSRFRSIGIADASFGENGLLPNPKGYLREFCTSSHNDIFSFGSEGEPNQMVVNSYNNRGEPNLFFGSSGTLKTPVEANLPSYAFGGGTIQKDGKLIQYSTNSGSRLEIVLARYDDQITAIETNSDEIFGQAPFPNPTQNTLNLPEGKNLSSLKLYNIQGKQFKILLENKTQLNVSHLPEGLFFLEIDNSVYRFVKE